MSANCIYSFTKQTVPMACLPSPVLEAGPATAHQGFRSPVLAHTFQRWCLRSARAHWFPVFSEQVKLRVGVHKSQDKWALQRKHTWQRLVNEREIVFWERGWHSEQRAQDSLWVYFVWILYMFRFSRVPVTQESAVAGGAFQVVPKRSFSDLQLMHLSSHLRTSC